MRVAELENGRWGVVRNDGSRPDYQTFVTKGWATRHMRRMQNRVDLEGKREKKMSETGSKVRWKDVPGFEGLHKAGSDGSVKNLKTGRISSKGNGIRLINKRGEEVKTTKPRVVLTAFRGPPPSDQHYAVRIDRSGGWELKNLAGRGARSTLPAASSTSAPSARSESWRARV